MKPEQITAWALDEASTEERQQLEAALAENPKTKQTADETKEFCHFLLGELRDESLAFTDEQREKLKQVVQASRLPENQPASETLALRPKWRMSHVVRLALAACVALGGFWTWQAFEAKHAVPMVAAVDEVAYSIQSLRRSEINKLEKSESEVRMLAELPVTAVVVKEMERVAGKPLAAPAMPEPAPTAGPLALNKDIGTMSAGAVATLKQIQDRTAYGLNFDAQMTPLAERPRLLSLGQAGVVINPTGDSKSINLMTAPVVTTKSGTKATMPVTREYVYTGDTTVNAGTLTINGGGPLSPAAPASALPNTSSAQPGLIVSAGTGGTTLAGGVVSLGRAVNTGDAGDMTKAGAGTLTLGGANTYTGATTISGGTLAVTDSRAKELPAVTLQTAATVPTTLDLSGMASGGNTLSIANGTRVVASPPAAPMLVMNPQPDAHYFAKAGKDLDGLTTDSDDILAGRPTVRDAKSANETYTRIIENELKDVAREPLSTLSIDVDTASYANVRRFLNQNMIPPADAVRIEELVNYFPTSEEGPAHDAQEPFAVRVELAPCPWQPVHRLARIAIKGRELGDDRKASNLVFLVDVSGSMNEPQKLPLVQQTLRLLTEQLGEGDRVTMVVYAGSSGLVLPPTNGEKKAEILAAIEKLQAGGGTHGSAGIQLAYEQAVAGFIKGGVNRVILCTDGDFNVGVSSPEELEKLITQKAKSGVFLSVLGFGSGNLKDRTMATLADKGNGNYAYIGSLSEARKVLVEQMNGTLVTIAKDVKIQVEFNPAAVRSYRLIGYENRLLAKEDFNDDAKDAGEIGAGHSVVALYEIVPTNLPPGAEPRPLVDGLKYQTAAAASVKLAEAAQSGEMMTVKLRYKEPEGMASKLIEVPTKDEGKTLTASSEEFKFSAAVVGFGLLLRDSSYQGTLSWETVRKLALAGKGTDKLGYRGEFLQLLDKARGLKETRP